MHINRIKTIYQSFINSQEYDLKFRDMNFDHSWLEKVLNYDEILRLEVEISNFSSLHSKAMFECGFMYAWQLFHQCDKGDFLDE